MESFLFIKKNSEGLLHSWLGFHYGTPPPRPLVHKKHVVCAYGYFPCLYTCTVCTRRPERVFRRWKLQRVVSCAIWVLGTEPRASGRTAGLLAIFPGPAFPLWESVLMKMILTFPSAVKSVMYVLRTIGAILLFQCNYYWNCFSDHTWVNLWDDSVKCDRTKEAVSMIKRALGFHMVSYWLPGSQHSFFYSLHTPIYRHSWCSVMVQVLWTFWKNGPAFFFSA